MKAVILVGGEGTRLRPLTCNTPKPMLPLVNRPLLEHVLSYLKRHGINDVILSMCYRPDVIEEHVGDGSAFGMHVRYAVETVPLGTAGAVKNVERLLEGTFFVFNGDILTDLDLTAMLASHRSNKAKATISLTPVDDPTAYGLVETAGDGRVAQFVEKPSRGRVTTNLINAGTYVLEPEVLEHVPADTSWMFERSLFPLLLQRNDAVFGYPSQAYWIDIGTPHTYLTAHRDVLLGNTAASLPGKELRQGVWVGDGVEIHDTAELVPPLVLGDRVRIEGKATLIGPLAIGEASTICRDALVEGSVIWAWTAVQSGAKISGCLIGSRCHIGEHVEMNGGAVVSDDCMIGRENKLDRGIKIWPGTNIEANRITF